MAAPNGKTCRYNWPSFYGQVNGESGKMRRMLTCRYLCLTLDPVFKRYPDSARPNSDIVIDTAERHSPACKHKVLPGKVSIS